MPAENDNKERQGQGTVDLHVAVTGLLQSILAARVALDRETAEVAALYQRHEILKQFNPPAFGFEEVTLRLPFAAIDLRGPRAGEIRPGKASDTPHMQVQVNAEVLSHYPPHVVGAVEIKLTPELLSLLLGEK
jgi:hypothetical protein